ncbi:hypothetical protein [Candidatus Hodarchaeum mangrovi]
MSSIEIDQLESVSLHVFKAIFGEQKNVQIGQEIYRIHKTKSGLRNVTIEGIFFIEQNPNKDSHWAKQAQTGHKILWGLKGRRYVLRVMDGQFQNLIKKRN